MGITVAVTRVACDTGGGNQTITAADLGGLTPKAALFMVTSCVTDGTAADHAIIGIGAATGTGNRWTFTSVQEHNQGTTDVSRRGTTDECIQIVDNNGAIDGEADFVSFNANNVIINWGDAPSAAYLMTVVLFAGTDLSAHADTATLGNQDVESDVTDPGFEPDVVLMGTPGYTLDDAEHTGGWMSFGVAVNKTGVPQYCTAWWSENAVAAASTRGIISDDYGIGQISNSDTWTWSGEVSGFDTNGFSITPRGGNSGDDVGYLALRFNNAVDFKAGILTTPTGAGSESVTDPSFCPQFLALGLTQLTSVDSVDATGNGSSIGFSFVDEDDQYCTSVQSEDAADPTNTQSLSDNQIVNLPNDDGTTAHTATLTSLDTNGWTWNFTNTEGTAVYYWYLAIGDADSAIPTFPVAVPARIPISLPSYELWLTDDYGTRLAQVTSLTTLTASRVVNGIGWFEMVVPSNFDTNLIAPDNMVQLWRAPAGSRLTLWRVYFIRRWRFETQGSERRVVIGGPDLNDLLRRRIAVGYSGSTYATKSDYADDMMKELVSEAESDTPTPIPSAGTRVWTNLTQAGDLGDGPTLNKVTSWGHLLTSANAGILADVAKAAREAGTEVFFDIVPATISSTAITLQFRTYTNQPGADRTVTGTVFDEQRGNLEDAFLEYDYSGEVNYVYAGGQGEDTDRNIQQVYDSDRYVISQWARCEAFADARNEATNNGVREAGRALLQGGRPIRRFGGVPVDTGGTRFGVDWDIGDRVTARYGGQEFEAIIRTVSISLDGKGVETVQARLEWEGSV